MTEQSPNTAKEKGALSVRASELLGAALILIGILLPSWGKKIA